jgi:DNA (cytosine-5)-methyltransferase 1
VTRPLVIDLFCKQGGAGEGYRRAGFRVVGIDIDPQPRYPFPFVCADWREALAQLVAIERPALVHASPPCQRYTTGGRVKDRGSRPDLVGPVREALRALGVPYVIENVPGAPLERPTVLCGSMFGLGVRRHRLFETSFPSSSPCACDHAGQGPIVGVYGRPHGQAGAWPGMRPSTLATWSEAMGIGWMDADGLSQAIPPAYTEHLGRQALAFLGRDRDQ